MPFKISTGLRNGLLAGDNYIALMDGKIFRCYGYYPADDPSVGTPPSNAQDAISGQRLLGTLSLDGGGTGVTFESVPVNGMAVKSTAETWGFVVTAAGIPTFYRHVDIADDGTASSSALRAQGTIDLISADMIVNTIAWTIGMTLPPFSSYAVGLPGE